jgi:phenylalanyl-tRNA synthetase alpha chain
MRLLVTGRVVRASRSVFIFIEPRRWNSTDAAIPEPSQPTGTLPSRHSSLGSKLRASKRIDIHPHPSSEAVAIYFEGLTFHKNKRDQTDSDDAVPHSDPGRDPSARTEARTEARIEAQAEAQIEAQTEAQVDAEKQPHPSLKLDSTSNLSPSILKLFNRRLYEQPDHPIAITKDLIDSVFDSPTYQHYSASNPVVSTTANFDVLGFPAEHPSRSPTDTYYVNQSQVLRTHTSVHQYAAFHAMKKPHIPPGYTICADVFRRDSIDRSHFPIFHQMEGARLWRLPTRDPRHHIPLTSFESYRLRLDRIIAATKEIGPNPVKVQDDNQSFNPLTNPKQLEHNHQEVRVVAAHLKRSLEHLVCKLFSLAQQPTSDPSSSSPPLELRWTPAYFPFTSPSWELEVFWQGNWLELLGCGVVQQRILLRTGVGDRIGWAWGLGIERLAMLLFAIPDIRLFWSEDARFLSQFRSGSVARFVPFSKFPACYKDVAFWLPGGGLQGSESEGEEEGEGKGGAGGAEKEGTTAPAPSPSPSAPAPTIPFHENDLMELVRDIAGSLAENVELVDEFVHPVSGRQSRCYRVNYRSLERTLTNEEVNALHERLGRRLVAELGVELR